MIAFLSHLPRPVAVLVVIAALWALRRWGPGVFCLCALGYACVGNWTGMGLALFLAFFFQLLKTEVAFFVVRSKP